MYFSEFYYSNRLFSTISSCDMVWYCCQITIVLLELLLIATLIIFMPRILRDVKESSLPTLFAFPKAVDEHVKNHRIIHVICSELLMYYYAFANWRTKPNMQQGAITLHKNSSYIAFQVMFIHAIVIETLGIHWWLHDKSMIASLILLVLNIYSVIFILADIQAVRLNPVHHDEEKLYISLGLMKRMELKFEDIDEIIEDTDTLQQKLTDDTMDFVARDFGEV
ncbi:hypothetical protein [Aeribacillus pallidus]|uniref:hypothetical protein n=1 Tax=Aeribacillus pallidus TaxID=33936 RepID=UPI001F074358|nr:hypothetical protein [Aeribacillus pallidus]